MVTAALASGACADPAAPARPAELPTDAVLLAVAEGVNAGLTVTCRIDFIATLHPTSADYRGTMGGEIQRKALAPDESGISFFGDAYYADVRVVVSSDGRASIASYQDGVPVQPTGESRFWDELRSFEGRYDASSRTVSGSWTCRPVDAHGDTAGAVEGHWTLQAAGSSSWVHLEPRPERVRVVVRPSRSSR